MDTQIRLPSVARPRGSQVPVWHAHAMQGASQVQHRALQTKTLTQPSSLSWRHA